MAPYNIENRESTWTKQNSQGAQSAPKGGLLPFAPPWLRAWPKAKSAAFSKKSGDFVQWGRQIPNSSTRVASVYRLL